MDRQKDKTSAVPLIALFLFGPILIAGIFLARRESNRVAALNTQVATLQPTATPRPSTAPTATPSPAPLTVIVGAANVREGPGLNHDVIEVVERGQSLRGPLSTQHGWLQVCCVAGGKRGWISGELVQASSLAEAIDRSATATPTRTAKPADPYQITARPTNTRAIAQIEPDSNQITKPPQTLPYYHRYHKYLYAQGAHIVATKQVRGQTMRQARNILYQMLSTRPDLLTAMTRKGLRIIIYDDSEHLTRLPEFAAWPLASHNIGGYKIDDHGIALAVPEAKLRCSPVLIHEIAHAVEYTERTINRPFAVALDRAYRHAMQAGLWKGKYAATNKHEYWAVAVQIWFRPRSSKINLRKYDPEIAELVESVFGNAKVPGFFCF